MDHVLRKDPWEGHEDRQEAEVEEEIVGEQVDRERTPQLQTVYPFMTSVIQGFSPDSSALKG